MCYLLAANVFYSSAANRSAREKEMWQQWDAQIGPSQQDIPGRKSKRMKGEYMRGICSFGGLTTLS